MADEPRVLGCPGCGRFVEAPGSGTCIECGGALVELGGETNADKAAALVAWARRDATGVIESTGTMVGAALGLALGLLPALAGLAPAASVIVLAAYYGIVGSLAGRWLALPIYRLLRPKSALVPVVSEAARRRLGLTALVLALVPPALWLVVGLIGERRLAHLVGWLWRWLEG